MSEDDKQHRLDYAGARRESPRTDYLADRPGAQFALGFATWVATETVFLACLIALHTTEVVNWTLLGLFSAIAVLIAMYFRISRGWKGFLPGVLAGMCLGCLVPFGILSSICGGGVRLR